jgi:hypothetical protein
MEFKEIINQISQYYKQPHYYFERVVLKLLEKYIAGFDKPMFTYVSINDIKGEFDAMAPEGIETEIPTIVEIKFIRHKSVILFRQIVRRLAERTRPLHDKFRLLLILPFELKKAEKERVALFDKEKFPSLSIEVWGIDDLNPLFNKYAEFVSDLIPQAGDKAIKNIVNKSLEFKDWKKERDKLIDNLTDAHKRDDLTIFLGAGVSASAELPDWNSLLSQLLVTLISKNLPKSIEVTNDQKLVIAKSLQQLNSSSPLLEARYVNSGLGETFESEVSKILYRNVTNTTSSDLLKAIANICIPPRGALGVRALVTYNFDDLIENELQRIGLKYRSIYKDVDIPLKEELGVFHVHGFLPRDTNAYDGISESLLVFSEKNYHTLMQDPYFWSNLIQLNFFRENTCLLIGLSGTDPNLRRLLEIAKRKTKIAKHFILLKRTPNDVFINNFKEKKVEYDDSLIEAINAIHHNLHERSFDELGLNVIWYNNHDEIPSIINSISGKI